MIVLVSLESPRETRGPDGSASGLVGSTWGKDELAYPWYQGL